MPRLQQTNGSPIILLRGEKRQTGVHMWLQSYIDLILLIVFTEATVHLWFHAAPLRGPREWLIKNTPTLYSKSQATHLLGCKYCLSVWVGISTVLMYWYIDYSTAVFIMLCLTIHRLSNFLHLCWSIIQDWQMDIRTNRGKRRRA